MPAPENLAIQTPGDTTANTTAAAEQNAKPADTSEPPAAPAFTIKHNGGGRWVVLDAKGEKVGAFVGAKPEAEAELARLVAGGEPMQPPAKPARPNDEEETPAAPVGAAVDPSTLKQAVLTSDGWLCPEPKAKE